MHELKLRKRIFVSVLANICRSLLGFLSGVALARSLSPEGYGNLMFILGGFGALLAAFDMGASTAFYTLISRKNHLGNYLRVYLAWLTLQLIVVLLGMIIFLPQALIHQFWLGVPRENLILGFFAIFLQQQSWQLVIQIAEARRESVKIQILNVGLAFSYFISILFYILNYSISVQAVTLLLIGNYSVAIIIATVLLGKNQTPRVEVKIETLPQVLNEFWLYCRPLIVLSLLNFTYDFGDKWMLQYFGGSHQQGIYQIAGRFSALSLIVSSAMLNILWKEIAEANANKNHQMVTVLYNKFYKGIFMITAVVAGFMIPWSEEIIDYFLGAEYGQGKVVLAIMLAYPIYQSMGQVCGTIIFALGETRRYMLICSAVMLCSVPLTYVLLASPASQIPGFSLGASGIAAKMLLIGFITGNIQAMLVSHVCGVKFDFFHQFATICLVLLSGFIAKSLSTSISMEFGGWLSLPLFTIIYSMAIIFVLVKHVDLLGMKSEELSALLTAVRTRFAL